MNYLEMMNNTLNRRCIEVREPWPGVRHNKETIYVCHRFEVVGGITQIERMRKLVTRNNALLEHLKERGQIR